MSLRKNDTLTGWTLLDIYLHFWTWLLLYSAITPKSEDKYVQKCSTRQSFIFPKWHSFKIGTLAGVMQCIPLCVIFVDRVIGWWCIENFSFLFFGHHFSQLFVLQIIHSFRIEILAYFQKGWAKSFKPEVSHLVNFKQFRFSRRKLLSNFTETLNGQS